MGPTVCYPSDNHVQVTLLTVLIVHTDIYFKVIIWQCCGLGLLKGRAPVNRGASILDRENSEDVDQTGSAGGSTTCLSAAAFVCKGTAT